MLRLVAVRRVQAVEALSSRGQLGVECLLEISPHPDREHPRRGHEIGEPVFAKVLVNRLEGKTVLRASRRKFEELLARLLGLRLTEQPCGRGDALVADERSSPLHEMRDLPLALGAEGTTAVHA